MAPQAVGERDLDGATMADLPSPEDAWQADGRAMSAQDVAHLLRRVAANGVAGEISALAGRAPGAAVSELISEPPTYNKFEEELRPLEDAAVRAGAADAYRTWFLRRLVASPWPLREWMTVFWLEFFGLGIGRVGELSLFDDVVRAIRRLALGRYREMLTAVLLHPAFLLNVRASANYRSAPNDRVGAAILRTCLGYREDDFAHQARELARAYCGRFVNRGILRVSDFERDVGEKVVLGRRDTFVAEAVPSLIAEDARATTWTVRRLYRWFFGHTPMPDDAFLSPVAAKLQASGSLADALHGMLCSRWFFSAGIRHRQLRRPLQFVASLLRTFQGRVKLGVVNELVAMGQDVLQPTTLDGWPDACHYLTPLALIRRMKFAVKLVSQDEKLGGGLARQACDEFGNDLPQAVVELLSDGEVPSDVAPQWSALRARYAESAGAREQAAASMICLLATSAVFQTA